MDPDGNRRLWPSEAYRLIVFPVTGASEGHYIHVEILCQSTKAGALGTHELLFLCKTFSGWDQAWGIAKMVGSILDV